MPSRERPSPNLRFIGRDGTLRKTVGRSVGRDRGRRAQYPHIAMGRFVVDASAVLHLVVSGQPVASAHKLLAPTLLRSQVLSTLHEAVQRNELNVADARARLARIGQMPIRLLGDAVLRRRAWEVADRLGWASTYDAEYVALTQLQADAFVTTNQDLARKVHGVVPLASVSHLGVKQTRRR